MRDMYQYSYNIHVKTAVILCAGFSTRMGALAKELPKPLFELNKGVTFLDIIVANLVCVGIKTIIITTHHKADKIHLYVIKNYLKKYKNCQFILSEEKTEILDTGGGLLNATRNIDDKYVLSVNCDTVWDESASRTLLKLQFLFLKKVDMDFYMVFGKNNIDSAIRFSTSEGNKVFFDKNGEYNYLGIQIINIHLFKRLCIDYNAKVFSLRKIYLDYKDDNGRIKNAVGVFHEGNKDVFHVGTLKELESVRNSKWLK